MLSTLIGPIVNGLLNIVDQAVVDKDEAARIKSRLQEMVLTGQMKEVEAAAQAIVAEAQGESWLQRNWRPLLMCLFGVIVANNYIVHPWFGVPMLPLPPDMWELLKIGVGGYVVGRSVEKGIRVWRDPT